MEDRTSGRMESPLHNRLQASGRNDCDNTSDTISQRIRPSFRIFHILIGLNFWFFIVVVYSWDESKRRIGSLTTIPRSRISKENARISRKVSKKCLQKSPYSWTATEFPNSMLTLFRTGPVSYYQETLSRTFSANNSLTSESSRASSRFSIESKSFSPYTTSFEG